MPELLTSIAWASLPEEIAAKRLAHLAGKQLVNVSSETAVVDFLNKHFTPPRGTKKRLVRRIMDECAKMSLLQEARRKNRPVTDRLTKDPHLDASRRRWRTIQLVGTRIIHSDNPSKPLKYVSAGRLGEFMLCFYIKPGCADTACAKLKLGIKKDGKLGAKRVDVGEVMQENFKTIADGIFQLAGPSVRRAMVAGQRVKFLPDRLAFEVEGVPELIPARMPGLPRKR